MRIVNFKTMKFLSNFWECSIEIAGMAFPTAEHAYQAQKTHDLAERERIRGLLTPGRAKHAGGRVVLRPDWIDVKEEIMLSIVKAKFEQNSDLANALLSTDEAEIVEGNLWHDNFWGDCSCAKCKNRAGRNALGEILMKVRDELRAKLS